MYKISVTTRIKGKKDNTYKEFIVDAPGEGNYKKQMNEVADYLYDLDIDFDVDEDGDMIIDDLLMGLSDQEELEEVIQEKKQSFVIRGEMLP